MLAFSALDGRGATVSIRPRRFLVAERVSTPARIVGREGARRRRISPEAGHALEILGHAIEYLADEYIHCGGAVSAQDGQVEAVQLLMKMNRQIYFACPEAPTFGERWRALLHLRAA
jgi:hypothetical protein